MFIPQVPACFQKLEGISVGLTDGVQIPSQYLSNPGLQILYCMARCELMSSSCIGFDFRVDGNKPRCHFTDLGVFPRNVIWSSHTKMLERSFTWISRSKITFYTIIWYTLIIYFWKKIQVWIYSLTVHHTLRHLVQFIQYWINRNNHINPWMSIIPSCSQHYFRRTMQGENVFPGKM